MAGRKGKLLKIRSDSQLANLWVQGEKIFSGTVRKIPVVNSYTPGYAFTTKTMLYSCALNDPPEHVSDCRKSYFDIEGDQD
jgi:hypothetical protein